MTTEPEGGTAFVVVKVIVCFGVSSGTDEEMRSLTKVKEAALASVTKKPIKNTAKKPAAIE
jgi:hypothetical protein